MSRGAARVEAYLESRSLAGRAMSFPEGATQSSQQAAEAIGCSLGQVIKSLVLLADGTPVLALVAGDRMADRKAIAHEAGARRCWFADPEAVVQATGYEVGGVSPFDLPETLEVLVDDSLERFEQVWPAGGDAQTMVSLTMRELIELSGGRMARISLEPRP